MTNKITLYWFVGGNSLHCCVIANKAMELSALYGTETGKLCKLCGAGPKQEFFSQGRKYTCPGLDLEDRKYVTSSWVELMLKYLEKLPLSQALITDC